MAASLKKGKSPYQAAAKARENKKLKNPILQLEQRMAQPFEGIVAQVFGLGSPNQQMGQGQSTGDTGAAMKELSALMQQYMQAKGMK